MHFHYVIGLSFTSLFYLPIIHHLSQKITVYFLVFWGVWLVYFFHLVPAFQYHIHLQMAWVFSPNGEMEWAKNELKFFLSYKNVISTKILAFLFSNYTLRCNLWEQDKIFLSNIFLKNKNWKKKDVLNAYLGPTKLC